MYRGPRPELSMYYINVKCIILSSLLNDQLPRIKVEH